MRVFVAGSTGAIGRFLAPLLVEAGHQVVALVHTPEKSPTVEAFGVEATVADALDRAGLTAAVRRARPDVIVHQLTAIRYLEDAVRAARELQALALRYGPFYGPGTAIATDGSIVDLVRRRRFPIVGDGEGVWSFIEGLG